MLQTESLNSIPAGKTAVGARKLEHDHPPIPHKRRNEHLLHPCSIFLEPPVRAWVLNGLDIYIKGLYALQKTNMEPDEGLSIDYCPL